ncbi:hypothetical protein SPRG_17676, partial [Saprolegnia parasitica CBS 223.65]
IVTIAVAYGPSDSSSGSSTTPVTTTDTQPNAQGHDTRPNDDVLAHTSTSEHHKGIRVDCKHTCTLHGLVFTALALAASMA